MKETIFCIISAFILYEVSGIIGKEMLADKHITGEGKGYCDITFGKESKKSLIINIQYNIFAPIIYMLLIATVLQNIGQEEGKRYTQEQVQMLAEAIEAGETPFPKEKGEELLVKFGIGRKKPARWTEKQKEGIRKTLKEVQSWTQLAEVWMEKYLKVE